MWQLSEQVKAGTITLHEFMSAEAGMSRSAGTCNTMGTASTMACMAEALGVTLPHNAAIPAVDARRYVLAHLSGMRIVEMALEGLTLSKILTREAFENAIRVNAAIGGSTNAVIHLKAIAGRIGVPLELEDWTRIGRGTPTLVDLMPSGRFLMEEFYYAGGLPAVLRRPRRGRPAAASGRADRERPDASGTTSRTRRCYNDEVIRPLDKPLVADGGMCVLRGNLAPRGAVLKPSAATAALLRHRGRAVVFENLADYKARIADPGLDVTRDSVLVLKNCGPRGYPGMAEVGNMGLPPKLLAAGRDRHGAHLGRAHERHRVRHGGAARRARGARGRPARGRPRRRLDRTRLRRRAACIWTSATPNCSRASPRGRRAQTADPADGAGYRKLYVEHVLQADEGCDFDFLVGCRGAAVPTHSH